ncbi:MAG: hypothetical protein F6K09_06920, partial [Merismopedia sp. SIO2A8]|nr:hypothetical protein [Merismopedia sp. SIO2A8]
FWLYLWILFVSCLLLGATVAGIWASVSNIQQQQPSPSIEVVFPNSTKPTWNQPAWQIAVDQLPRTSTLPTKPAQRHPLAPSIYEQAMDVGYAAYREKDYHTALINFQRALEDKAGDRYATEAIANTEAIIQYRR